MTLAQDRIEHLRVRKSSSRSHAEAVLRQLSTLDLHAPGLAPSAVLVVRRLQDPLPGHVGRHGEWRLPDRWRQALGASLARAVDNAARPLDGVLPSGCEAVVFADEAELFACLVLDMALGTWHERWWWQSIVANLAPQAQRSVAHLLEHQLPLMPAALTLLDTWQRAPLIANALSRQETESLTRKLVAHFGVGGVAKRDAPTKPSALRPTSASPKANRATADESPHPNALPPWSGLLRSAFDAIPAAEALFGLAVLLSRSPGRAREFASATARWLESRERRQKAQREHARQHSRQHSRMALSIVPTAKPDRAEPRARATRSTAPVHTEPVPHVVPSVVPSTVAADRTRGDEHGAALDTEESTSHTRGQLPSPSAATRAIQPSAATRDEAVSPGATPKTTRQVASAPGHTASEASALDPSASVSSKHLGGFRTRLGGVFYLVNLLDHLDLPGVFEPDFRLGSTLGAWGTLELVGRALLGPECPHHDDPLWEVLGELTGRGALERLGEGYRSAAEALLPERWDRGFRRPLGEHRSLAWLSNWVASPDLIRWTEAVLPFLEARLAASMGLAERAPSQEAWCVPARVHLAPLHIDVVMSLEDISIAMRRSGLDRSPAWVASFGKIILIHFEGP